MSVLLLCVYFLNIFPASFSFSVLSTSFSVVMIYERSVRGVLFYVWQAKGGEGNHHQMESIQT